MREQRGTRRDQFPVIIGVTGHRDIATHAIPAVRAAVNDALKDWRTHFGAALHVLTALADGADQLIADEARVLGIPIIAVLPMPPEKYRERVANKTGLDEHWRDATLRLQLPDVEPAYVAGYDERQYEQLGILLARRSHLLLALWDGKYDATQRAGTGPVVRARLFNEERAEVSRESHLFLGASSQLRLVNPGPLLHILTPRHDTIQEPGQSAGDCRLYDIRGPWRQQAESAARIADAGRPVRASDSHASLDARTLRDFAQLVRLNAKIESFDDAARTRFHAQVNEFPIEELPDEAGNAADEIRRLQAAADIAAQDFQGRLMGHVFPARSLRHMLTKAAAVWNLGHWPKLGAVFWLTATVPVAVLSFEAYAHLHGTIVAYAIYMIALGYSYWYYQRYVANHDLQNQFQDYRALAEAMRVQLFWGLSAVPSAVSDYYLGKQIGELGWIQLALRGPALWALALAESLGKPRRQLVRSSWIVNQMEYFERSGELHESVAHRSREWVRLLLLLAVVASATLLVLEASCLISGACEMESSAFPAFWFREILRVIVATSPVIGGAFSVSGELRAYEPHARSYALMRLIFARADAQAERIETMRPDRSRNDEFRRLSRELGREALAENAEWLVEHRHRSVKNELVVEPRQTEDGYC